MSTAAAGCDERRGEADECSAHARACRCPPHRAWFTSFEVSVKRGPEPARQATGCDRRQPSLSQASPACASQATRAMDRRRLVSTVAAPLIGGALVARLVAWPSAAPKRLLTVQAQAAPAESAVRGAANATHRAPPIPPRGPTSAPKSLHQVGLSAELTQRVFSFDNPQTPEKIALGLKLFFDGRLSADGTVACATCHDPRRAFTDGQPASIGIGGRVGQRNAPTIM